MKINRFEDILAWQKAIDLAVECRRLFRVCKDYSFLDQLFRAVVSISNNIAEGFERSGDKEFRKFLFIAKGSCGEVRSMLHLAEKLGYLESKNSKILQDKSTEISKILSGLIKSMNP